MARSRNIKPAFFANECLAELPALDRLLFIGLWTIADYKGCLEDRKKRIKAQILPYDNCDIEKIMINLERSRFITSYSVDGIPYIKINNFERHQNPHPNEKKSGSKIPDIDAAGSQVIDNSNIVTSNDEDVTNRDEDVTDRASSLLLIPSNPLTDPLKKEGRKKFAPPCLEEVSKYCAERNNRINPQSFIDFYESKGWMVGKNKMKDWKACVRTWEQREVSNGQKDTRSRAKRVSDKLDEIARRDIEENGFTDFLG